MKRALGIAFALSVLAVGTLVVGGLAAGCKRSETKASTRFTRDGDHRLNLARPRGVRQYMVRLPPNFATRGPLPVLIAYHGEAADMRVLKKFSGLDERADLLGYVVVYPNGTGRFGKRFLSWNAGECCGFAKEQDVDDVGFTFEILADLARDLPLDRTRVYATGHSNGAMMAYRLAADAAPRIAAIVPVSGPDMTLQFAPTAPVSVLHVHSVDDPRALFAGGRGPNLARAGKPVEQRSVEAGLARWRQRDGCTGTGREVDTRAADQHGAVLIDFAPCSEGTDVALWKLTGPGHDWPGGPTRRLSKLMGPTTVVIHAADEVFAFIARYSKPDAPELGTR